MGSRETTEVHSANYKAYTAEVELGLCKALRMICASWLINSSARSLGVTLERRPRTIANNALQGLVTVHVLES